MDSPHESNLPIKRHTSLKYVDRLEDYNKAFQQFRPTGFSMIHCIFDEAFDEPGQTALPDMTAIFSKLNLPSKHYVVTPQNVAEKTKDIPKDDLIFLHADLPENSPPYARHIVSRYMLDNFPYVAGISPEFIENTSRKSVIYEIFEKKNVPYLRSLSITSESELRDPNIKERIRALGSPIFMKVDAGFDSLGLTEECIQKTPEAALEVCERLFHKYGPVVMQRFVGGREFTVSAAKNEVGAPVERIFGDGENFSPSGGTKRERVMTASQEPELWNNIRELARKAFDATGGTYYGRIDIRQDPESLELFCLEVNALCSLGDECYFDLSLAPYSISKEDVIAECVIDAFKKGRGK